MNVPSDGHFRQFLRLTVLLFAMILAIYAVLGFAADKLAETMSPKFEAAIAGKIVSRTVHDDFPRTSRYLQQILDSLVRSAEGLPDFAYKVSIQDGETVNALALPGGRILVFKGLVTKVRSENEMAMILAHELGHYAHRDHLHGLGRGLVLASIYTVLGLSGDVPGFIAPSIQTFGLKRSRDQESSADQFAIDTMVRAYGHTEGSIGVFKVLAREEKSSKRPDFLSTHPDTLWRMQSLANYVKRRNYPKGVVKPLPDTGGLPLPGDS